MLALHGIDLGISWSIILLGVTRSIGLKLCRVSAYTYEYLFFVLASRT